MTDDRIAELELAAYRWCSRYTDPAVRRTARFQVFAWANRARAGDAEALEALERLGRERADVNEHVNRRGR